MDLVDSLPLLDVLLNALQMNSLQQSLFVKGVIQHRAEVFHVFIFNVKLKFYGQLVEMKILFNCLKYLKLQTK